MYNIGQAIAWAAWVAPPALVSIIYDVGVPGKKCYASILMFAVLFSVPTLVLRCPDFISDVYFVIWFVV